MRPLLALCAVLLAAPSARASEITPAPRGQECHPMMGACPAGWHPKDPKAAKDDDSWGECCQDEGTFVPRPPQPHEKFPICNPKSREEWLAVGIEFEEGCDLRYSTCAIVYRPEPDGTETAPAAAKPPKPAAPAAKPRKAAATPPKTALVRRAGDAVPRESLAALVAGLKAEAAPERERAALGLAALGPKGASALGALTPLLRSDPSPRVRACAVVAAASVARTNGEALPLLRGVLSDPDLKVRAVAAQALKALGAAQ
ncbi:hypothetical protein EPO15_18595 [bacterium]|nr:MAG: hypothetical protein EPO15_18595 [bacterium]